MSNLSESQLSPSPGSSGPAFGDLLEPECLLPVQYNALVRKRSADDGEGRLLLAVLKDALRAYARNIGGRTERARRDFREAYTWFNAENQKESSPTKMFAKPSIWNRDCCANGSGRYTAARPTGNGSKIRA